MGKNFRDTLNERMNDPAFLVEWNAQEPERQIMRAIAEGREERDMTQKQLAEATGITQAVRATRRCVLSSVWLPVWAWHSRSSLFPSSRKRCEQMIQETIFSAQHTRTALRSEGSI